MTLSSRIEWSLLSFLFLILNDDWRISSVFFRSIMDNVDFVSLGSSSCYERLWHPNLVSIKASNLSSRIGIGIGLANTLPAFDAIFWFPLLLLVRFTTDASEDDGWPPIIFLTYFVVPFSCESSNDPSSGSSTTPNCSSRWLLIRPTLAFNL